MGPAELGSASNPRPRGWRRIILPFRWIVYRLVRPLLSEMAERCLAVQQSSAGLEQRHAGFEQELLRLRKDLTDFKQALAGARTEIADIDKRIRQSLALGWDHVALVRRLASIEEQLSVVTSQLSESAGAGKWQLRTNN